eukprot:2790616-Alexandrium_andersonii.AAC.1
MSASLVGSEMCIRDRAAAAAVAAAAAAATTTPTTSWTRSAWSASARVSYTHLTLPTICSV